MESYSEDALMEQEDECRKALRTLSKAIVIRLVVMVLLVVVMLRTGMELLVVGLVVFVTLINITSGILLFGEWKKQRAKLKEILSLYE